MKPSMKLAAVVAGIACAFVQSGAVAHDNDDRGKVVTVAFGNGINTAQPGNPENHHVLPGVIKVEVGDVVNFVVSGLHVIRVFDKGVRLRDVKDAIPLDCLTNPPMGTPFPSVCAPVLIPALPVPVLAATTTPPLTSLGLPLYYSGLNPLLTPPPGLPPFVAFSTTQNRVEAVSFSKPGRYLVICGVLPHFNDGMWAWIEVDRDRGHH
jgi:plastocyanin